MLKRFFRNQRGSAAVEFAFVAPIVIVLYFGMVEATRAMLADGRVSHVATAVGDLVTQEQTLTAAQVADIFTISTAIIRPLPTDKLGIRVTAIHIGADLEPVQRWTQSYNASMVATLPDALAGVPVDMRIAGANLIRTDTTYVYNSPIQGAMRTMNAPIHLGNTVFLSPRRPGEITYKN
jgi:Flp pilus assembly protein TadG